MEIPYDDGWLKREIRMLGWDDLRKKKNLRNNENLLVLLYSFPNVFLLVPVLSLSTLNLTHLLFLSFHFIFHIFSLLLLLFMLLIPPISLLLPVKHILRVICYHFCVYEKSKQLVRACFRCNNKIKRLMISIRWNQPN